MFRYHLQSYFLHLNRAALAERALVDEFLSTYVPVSDKHYVINAYEIGFETRYLPSRTRARRRLPVRGSRSTARQTTPFAKPGAGARIRPSKPRDALLERGFPFVKGTTTA